jgi:hypothetical protein
MKGVVPAKVRVLVPFRWKMRAATPSPKVRELILKPAPRLWMVVAKVLLLNTSAVVGSLTGTPADQLAPFDQLLVPRPVHSKVWAWAAGTRKQLAETSKITGDKKRDVFMIDREIAFGMKAVEMAGGQTGGWEMGVAGKKEGKK